MTAQIVSQNKASPQAQTERLAQYMAQGRVVHPINAWRELGIYRLSARIHDLRQRGVDVRGKYITVKDQFGQRCRVMSYYMAAKS